MSTLPIVEEALAEPRPGVLPGFPAAVLVGVAAGLDTVSEQASSPDTGLEAMLPPLEGEEQLTAQPSTPDLFEGLDPVRQGANTTPFVEQLLRGNPVSRLTRSARNALAFQKLSHTPWKDVVSEGLAMRKSAELTLSQVVMAANTPMLLKAAMVDGRPDLGVMASGQVVGLIDDLPSVQELLDRIMKEAEETLGRLARD